MARDLSNQIFGRLRVIKLYSRGQYKGGKQTHPRWLCECECGTERIVSGPHLVSGHTKSCGCSSIQHGHAQAGRTSRLFWRWANMLYRCKSNNPNYGGRGIKVCERWQQFENFLADMGEPPEGMSLDRIDNNGDYEPSNCRWATVEGQNSNRRVNHYYEYHGSLLTAGQLAKLARFPISAAAMGHRLRYLGWPLERALAEPIAGGRQ